MTVADPLPVHANISRHAAIMASDLSRAGGSSAAAPGEGATFPDLLLRAFVRESRRPARLHRVMRQMRND
jgi:hypothetical protein